MADYVPMGDPAGTGFVSTAEKTLNVQNSTRSDAIGRQVHVLALIVAAVATVSNISPVAINNARSVSSINYATMAGSACSWNESALCPSVSPAIHSPGRAAQTVMDVQT